MTSKSMIAYLKGATLKTTLLVISQDPEFSHIILNRHKGMIIPFMKKGIKVLLYKGVLIKLNIYVQRTRILTLW
jgi:hypothetical protein